MTGRTLQARARAVLLAIAAAACGPYANVAQKLDVTARVAGDTWIAAVGDRTELRVLLVGKAQSEGSVPFAFSSVHVPRSSGSTVTTLQGTWVEVGSAGATTLHIEHEYTLPDEAGAYILNRRGTYRDDVQYAIQLTVTRSAGQLIVAGDPSLAGTYVPLVEALGRLGKDTEQDAACAFQVSNLGMLTSEARIIGFGGAGLTQYDRPETYIGTVAGSLRISMALSGGFPPSHSTATIQYSGFEDVGGVQVDGPMITDADSSGSGQMSGRMTFAFRPMAADGTPGTPITGWIDYGGNASPQGADDPANAIQIVRGDPLGGLYTVAIDGGGIAQVPPATPPSPALAECLALP